MKKQWAEIPTRAKKSLDDLHQLFPDRSLMLVSSCLLSINLKLRNIVASKLILDWSPKQIQ